MNPWFSHNPQGFQVFQEVEHDVLSIYPGGAAAPAAAKDEALAYHVAVLRNMVQQLEPLVGMVVSPAAQHLRQAAAAMAVSSACSVLQRINAVASAMAHRLEHAGVEAAFSRGAAIADGGNEQMFAVAHQADISPFEHDPATVFVSDATTSTAHAAIDPAGSFSLSAASTSGDDVDIVELEASYLLARYTHYCQVCGKGFKRDANLRMHMRAHGDEYKTLAALNSPSGPGKGADDGRGAKKCYSCPAEGCRWNRWHPRFQPLKSVVCAKNHYRRNHCPKMYVCRRCSAKQFAVLSDLRTHEKHCGELRWRCSCGTFFSRKDKLMGHVALFAAGHAPVPVAAAATASPSTTERS